MCLNQKLEIIYVSETLKQINHRKGLRKDFVSDGKLKIGHKKPYVIRLPKNVAHISKKI